MASSYFYVDVVCLDDSTTAGVQVFFHKEVKESFFALNPKLCLFKLVQKTTWLSFKKMRKRVRRQRKREKGKGREGLEERKRRGKRVRYMRQRKGVEAERDRDEVEDE